MNQLSLPGSPAPLVYPRSFAALYAAADEQRKCELDERAAIYEFDGGMSRDAAEAQTAKDFQRKEAASWDTAPETGNGSPLVFA